MRNKFINQSEKPGDGFMRNCVLFAKGPFHEYSFADASTHCIVHSDPMLPLDYVRRYAILGHVPQMFLTCF